MPRLLLHLFGFFTVDDPRLWPQGRSVGTKRLTRIKLQLKCWTK